LIHTSIFYCFPINRFHLAVVEDRFFNDIEELDFAQITVNIMSIFYRRHTCWEAETNYSSINRLVRIPSPCAVESTIQYLCALYIVNFDTSIDDINPTPYHCIVRSIIVMQFDKKDSIFFPTPKVTRVFSYGTTNRKRSRNPIAAQ
jgi:hypothetical protein